MQIKKIKRELEKAAVDGKNQPAPPSATPSQIRSSTDTVQKDSSSAAPSAVPPGQGEMQMMQERLRVVESGIQSYATGQQQLRRADDNLQTAAKSLKVSQVSQGIETFQDMRIGIHGGGRFGARPVRGRALDRRNDVGHNLIEMGTIHRANAQVKEAARSIEEARRVLPNLPFVKPAQVQKAMSGAIFNALLAPGVVGDVIQMSRVKKASADIMEMHATVVQAVDWCTQNMSAAQTEAAQLRSSIHAQYST